MLVLGLILILVAVLVMVGFLVGGANDPGSLVIGSTFQWSPGSAIIFLTGVVTVLVLTAGFVLLQSGIRRARQHRRDVRELQRQVAQQAPENGGPAAVTDTTADGTQQTEPTGPATVTDLPAGGQPTQPGSAPEASATAADDTEGPKHIARKDDPTDGSGRSA